MATYQVRIAPAAQRQLERLPPPVQVRVRIAIRSLASNPRPPSAALIAGTRKVRVWRIKVGDYRVLYEIQDDQMVVLVVRAGHRGGVYRGPRISEASALYGSPAGYPQPHGGRSWTSQMLSADEV